VAVVEGSCYTGLDNTAIHQADTNAEAGSASLVGARSILRGYPFWARIRRNCIGPGLVGYFVGSSHNSFHYHTSVTAEFDAVEAFGEHVGVVVLTADVANSATSSGLCLSHAMVCNGIVLLGQC
jgi:hypothetical protein